VSSNGYAKGARIEKNRFSTDGMIGPTCFPINVNKKEYVGDVKPKKSVSIINGANGKNKETRDGWNAHAAIRRFWNVNANPAMDWARFPNPMD
jgi:hypothetical protein